MTWKSKQPSLKSSVERPEMPTDGSWPWRPTLLCTRTNILMQQELWFSSIECPRNEEKPLPRLGSPSSKTNTSPKQINPGPRSRKPSRLHLPLMMQQHKLELLSLHSTKTRRTPLDLTNISPHSPFSLSTLELPITMPCQNGSSADSIHRLQHNSLSPEHLKPPPPWRNFTPKPLRSKGVTTALHHLGEDPNCYDRYFFDELSTFS